MPAYIKDLETPSGDIVYPNTKTVAVWNDEGENLDAILANIGGTTIVVSVSQPATLKNGDLWYQII